MAKIMTIIFDEEDIKVAEEKEDIINHCIDEWQWSAVSAGYFEQDAPKIESIGNPIREIHVTGVVR